MGSSFFDRVSCAPADAIFQQQQAFKNDPRPHKVNLSIGLYQDEMLQTPILKTVKNAEKVLISQETTKEYLPISGDPLYLEESGQLIFGQMLWRERRENICGVQTPGGTGGLRIGAEFLRQEISKTIAIPDPTWPNHTGIFKQCGYQVHSYSYYDTRSGLLKIESILETLKKAPCRSIVLLHACCHNPTGADPSEKEWNAISELLREKELLPFFDFAYQGLGKGLEEDAQVIRSFVKRSIECVIAFSHSKNFGLYSERVGGVFVTAKNRSAAENVLSQLKVCARVCYSNPPRHGAAIVAQILSNLELREGWIKEVDAMRERIDRLRKEFVSALQNQQKVKDFSSLFSRVGMFCFLGLSDAQVSALREEDGIYMSSGGRINLAGLCDSNLERVTDAIRKIL